MQKMIIFLILKKLNLHLVSVLNNLLKNIFPIKIIISDKNHNFLFTKNISIQENLSLKNNSISYILLISVMGGFILNLMPCVFPVLSIKLLSVLNNQSKNIRLSFVYTAFGIITSFFFLALFF